MGQRVEIAQELGISCQHDRSYQPSLRLFPSVTGGVSRSQGCCVGAFPEDSGTPKLQNSPGQRTVDRQTEQLAFTWGSSSIKMWLETMGTRKGLKNERGQNEKLQQELWTLGYSSKLPPLSPDLWPPSLWVLSHVFDDGAPVLLLLRRFRFLEPCTSKVPAQRNFSG